MAPHLCLLVLLHLAIAPVLSLSPSWDPASNPAAVVSAGSARFTVLSPSLLRLQYSEGGLAFDERATAVVVNRHLPVPPFTVQRPNATSVVIATSALVLTYDFSSPPPLPGAPGCGYPQLGQGVVGGIPLPSAPWGLNSTTQGACCTACTADVQCVAWVYAPGNATCALFVQAPTTAPQQGAVLGRPWAPFAPASLRIDFAVAGVPTAWGPGAVDPLNLLGTYQKGECYTSPQACYDYYATMRGPGLVSRAGWYLHDDTRTLRTVPTPLPSAPHTLIPWHAPPTPPSAQAADWYLFAHGHNYRGALGDFVAVSGAAALPPAAAFGVAWSRWYTYSAESIMEEVVAGFAEHGLPLNTLTLDMDWHNELNDGGLCNSWGSYDWNTTLFPDPAAFSALVKSSANPTGHPLALSLNFHDSVGVDPCQQRYAAVAARMGLPPASNATVPCQFSNISYVDALWAVYLNAAPLAQVDAVWADWGGCDPPYRAPYSPSGAGGSFHMEQFSNLWWANHVMGVMAEAVQGRRPWSLYRYGGLGQQRYPVGFSGDTFQHFLTLQWEVETVASAANVAFPYWSYDIGGYMCSDASGCDANTTSYTGSELLVRWYQFGAFSPIFRTHCRQCERRVWLFPYFPQLKDALLLRNALFPFLYSEARATYDTGVATLHPLYYDWPEAAESYSMAGQYMLGSSPGAQLLLAPITAAAAPGPDGRPGAALKAVWLPPGAWANWNGTAVAAGPALLPPAPYGLGDVPAYAPAGALLPLKTMASVYTGAGPPNPLVWAAFPPATLPFLSPAPYALYEDDGQSLGYAAAAASAPAAPAAPPPSTTTSAQWALDSAGRATLQVAPQAGPGYPGALGVRTHWLQLRGGAAPPAGQPPAAVAVNGAAVPGCAAAPPGAGDPPCWWTVPAANHSLAAPAGCLHVSTGPVPVSEATTVEVCCAAVAAVTLP